MAKFGCFGYLRPTKPLFFFFLHTHQILFKHTQKEFVYFEKTDVHKSRFNQKILLNNQTQQQFSLAI